MGKDARGLTLFWSINYLVPPELGVNRRSRTIVEAVVNATNMTSPVVTPEAEFVNPWRARCRETGTAGSEGGVRKHRSAVRLAPTLPLSRRHPLNELLCFTAVVVALSSAAGGASPATNG
jgi:hypothetical protein